MMRRAMSSHLERAVEVRNDPTRHHNCAQGVLAPFAEECGLDEGLAYRLCSGFGGGLCSGRTCGALVGTIMALGLEGHADRTTVAAIMREFAQRHNGCTDCRDLLRASRERGEIKKEHCDGLVYEGVKTVDRIVTEADHR